MCLEFLDVSLRPFATHCFSVFLLLRNFQLVSSLFDGAALLTHCRAETTKQNLTIPPSRDRLRTYFVPFASEGLRLVGLPE
jgi:hypothetical protein